MSGIAFARTSQEGVRGITPNKLYMSTQWDNGHRESMYIIADNGQEVFILKHQCAHLKGKDWEFIKPSELGELI